MGLVGEALEVETCASALQRTVMQQVLLAVVGLLKILEFSRQVLEEGQVGQTAGQELPQAALTRQPRSAPNTHDSFNTNWSDRIFPLGDQPFL